MSIKQGRSKLRRWAQTCCRFGSGHQEEASGNLVSAEMMPEVLKALEALSNKTDPQVNPDVDGMSLPSNEDLAAFIHSGGEAEQYPVADAELEPWGQALDLNTFEEDSKPVQDAVQFQEEMAEDFGHELDFAQSSLEEIEGIMKQAPADNEADQMKDEWKVAIKGQGYPIREFVDKAALMFNKFAVPGPIAASIDPTHAASPLAAMEYVFQALTPNSEPQDRLASGLAKTTTSILEWDVYKGLYDSSNLPFKEHQAVLSQPDDKIADCYAQSLFFLGFEDQQLGTAVVYLRLHDVGGHIPKLLGAGTKLAKSSDSYGSLFTDSDLTNWVGILGHAWQSFYVTQNHEALSVGSQQWVALSSLKLENGATFNHYTQKSDIWSHQDGGTWAENLVASLCRQLFQKRDLVTKHLQDAIREDFSIADAYMIQQFNETTINPRDRIISNLNNPLGNDVVIFDAYGQSCGANRMFGLLLNTKGYKMIDLIPPINSPPKLQKQVAFSGIGTESHQKAILHDISNSVIQSNISPYTIDKLEMLADSYDTDGDTKSLPISHGCSDKETFKALVKTMVSSAIFAAVICRLLEECIYSNPELEPNQPFAPLVGTTDDKLNGAFPSVLGRSLTSTAGSRKSRKAYGNPGIDCLIPLSKHHLQKDAYGLSSLGKQRSEIGHQMINNLLPSGVQYACHYWTYHPGEDEVNLYDDNPAFWDASQETIQYMIEDHDGFIRAMHFSSDDKLMVSRCSKSNKLDGYDDMLKAWDTTKHTPGQIFDHEYGSSLTLVEDGADLHSQRGSFRMKAAGGDSSGTVKTDGHRTVPSLPPGRSRRKRTTAWLKDRFERGLDRARKAKSTLAHRMSLGKHSGTRACMGKDDKSRS